MSHHQSHTKAGGFNTSSVAFIFYHSWKLSLLCVVSNPKIARIFQIRALNNSHRRWVACGWLKELRHGLQREKRRSFHKLRLKGVIICNLTGNWCTMKASLSSNESRQAAVLGAVDGAATNTRNATLWPEQEFSTFRVTLMLLVANLGNAKWCKKIRKMTENLANRYSSESTERELSNEYKHGRV